ncbi:MAG: bifunctional (p)ppGpp synthetase/guanosine-3',5'-bis(diphosphate) 3'-pyrophosphohydrolase [Cellvibrionales bacterium]|nr:bifunctional (p)ppGpp synthetase/guanosine-3',5'-bis(diphosphate) 3'-pyrophosphohydrolase [Cellvibrionales bacterium]
MPGIDDLAERLTTYLNDRQVAQVRRAYKFAAAAHQGQYRLSGEPYVTHPLAAAHILADMHMDHHCLIGALLHDVIEDTAVSKADLKKKFGATVADLVDGVSKLGRLEGGSAEQQQAENFMKMILAMSRDIRVILVKLADRLHNMRTLGVLDAKKRRRIARETLEIYAPIAQRLGINDMRMEFEDLGFHAMYPMRAERLTAALEQARGGRKGLADEIQEAIEHRLERENFAAEVQGREKHLYSIYQKMRYRGLAFKDILDVFAFRICVTQVDECYQALGIMHNLFKPVAGTFKDYIAIPKANGYQSLHTVLIGMHGVPIEVQIRTRAMDDMANFGIAAHWFYKDNRNAAVSTRADEWVRRLLELQQQAGDPLEFIEHVKTDLFPDEVYVFTPQGKIIELPSGATAVDFAYALHTDIGDSTVGCKINNQPAPLSQKLESGQMVEMLRAAKAQPHPGWLDFATTARARIAIRYSLKHRQHEESVALGRRLLNRTLADLNMTVEQLDPQRIEQLLCDGGQQSFDEVLQQIGLGNLVPQAVAKLLVGEAAAGALKTQILSPIVIDSPEGQVVHFGRCCYPIPGDIIRGHLNPERGLVVHREECHNIGRFRNDPAVCVPIAWSAEVSGEFQVELRVEVDMFRGLVAQLATRIANEDASIDNISIEERGATLSVLKLMLRVTDRVHLANIMRRIRLEPYVKTLRRGANS